MLNIKSYNPSMLFLALLLVTFTFSFTLNLIVTLTLLALVWLLLLASHVEWRHFLRLNGIASLLMLSIFLGTYFWGRNAHNLILSFTVALRPVLFMNLGLLFLTAHDAYAFLVSLHQNFDLPSQFTYGILAIFNLMPQLKLQYKRNKLAFALRGQKITFMSPKLLLSLLFKTIYWVDYLEMAMLSKGFNAQEKRTYAHTYQIKKRDYGLLFASWLLSVLLIWISLNY
ncbi:ABC transporter [Streptococcus penaeicida]|uniref:ABC transporter n=1 Tax=Streptococcus penaeicida TaxID=1765960 RepID=A0A2N8LCA2_9STRE|nr:energy-coupling factor transporter transmembrane component T [Streptococcus penaeicida]PND47772.1 ABC transporter [Streptococcus penaeicida]